jgi:cytochrome P450
MAGTDAKEFKPERWLDDQGSLIKASQIKFPAFHAGPRTCLGQTLATQEAVGLLTLLARKFDFEAIPGQDIVYADSLTLPMKHGFKVRVASREYAAE